ncbi:hypothetical protein PPL_06538 [Heterostelium album PN500]|uniref:Nuclear RNA export factor 1 n=1 Tax=Heterostelium pallidum (strain ATCC 26659 / Pp 5 / PN500) TaxID=670386 RepID=D3BDF5_HETP5|nr:hypothetical protein PPL_06538 [Heterostelium album PN500]EFA80599.1 hypothetical protein PPL_06538 [Heterostelium album PN500]|eukprot:XP_020432719.1 hypothetical protein PPL_06538 [Heterostelium album PN500]
MSFRGRGGKRGGFGGGGGGNNHNHNNNNNNTRSVLVKRGGKQSRGGGRRFEVTNRNDDLPRVVISNLPNTTDANDVMDYLKNKSFRPNMVFKGSEFRNQKLFLTLLRNEDVQPLVNLSGTRYGGDKIFIQREDRSSSAKFVKQPTTTLTLTQQNKRADISANQQQHQQQQQQKISTETLLFGLFILEMNVIYRYWSLSWANTISFSHNNITSFSGFVLMTRFKLENLINFNFDSNKITDFDELDYLSDLPLRELLLSNNPIASQPNYRMEVAKRFPDLKFLDGVEIGPADFPPSPCPPLRPSFFDTVETQQFAYRFLQKYFTTFDTDRSNIVKAYSEDSIFSMTFSAGDDSVARGSVKQYGRSNRNLLKSLDLTKRTQLLYVGFEKIYNFFKLFPATTHNLSTPIVDALYVITHGFFTETSFCTKRSFDRVFVLAPAPPNSDSAKQGWEAVILNEQLHIRPYVRFPRLATDAVPPTPNTVTPAPTQLAAPEKELLLQQFKNMTSLKDEFAIECLDKSGWDLNNATQTFQTFNLSIE